MLKFALQLTCNLPASRPRCDKCGNCSGRSALPAVCGEPTSCARLAPRVEYQVFLAGLGRACAKTTAPRILTSRSDDGDERCRARRRPVQPSASSACTPPSKTLSTPNVSFSHAARFTSSGRARASMEEFDRRDVNSRMDSQRFEIFR